MFETQWDSVARNHSSMILVKSALVGAIKDAQSKYKQYIGCYDDDKGWKLATCRSSIGFKSGDLRPGVIFLAKPIVRNGEAAIEVCTYDADNTIIKVVHSIVTIDGGNVPGQNMSSIYFLEP